MFAQTEICIWSDYEWCLSEYVEEFLWKSDDYITISIPFIDEPSIEQLKECLGE